MRFRAATGWAVTVLLASVGCGQTSGANDPISGVGSGGGSASGSDGDGRDGPPAMALDFARSGTRVVALGYSSNEARIFRTFHDQKLDFDCTFVTDAVGSAQRCVPSATVTMVYTDPSCTEPAAWDEDWSPNAPVVGEAVSGTVFVETSCPGAAPPHRDAYRVGERLRDEVIAGTPEGLYQMYGGRCQTASPPAKFVPAVVRLTPIPESELARGERGSVDAGAGLRLTRLLADDGAELTLGVTSADRTPCALQSDGECVPEPIARPAVLLSNKFYTALNADCSAPAFQTPYPDACGIPTFGIDEDVDRLRVHTLTAPAAVFGLDLAEPVTDPADFTCSRKLVGDYGWLAAPARDVTGTLPTATKLRRGTGPLHVDWFGVGDRELLPVGAAQSSWGELPTARFADAQGRPCDVMPAPDGTLRCVLPGAYPADADLTGFPEVVAFTY